MRSGRKILHNLHNLHNSFLISAQRAVEVFVAVGQTYTTISAGDVVEKSPSGQVQDESITSRTQSPG